MKRKLSIWNRTFVQYRTVSAAKIIEFVSDRVPYIVLRGRWYTLIIRTVHASTDEKSNVSKTIFMRN